MSTHKVSSQWQKNVQMIFNACRYAFSPNESCFKMTADFRHFVALGGFHNEDYQGKSIYDLGFEENQIDVLAKDVNGDNMLFTAINSGSPKAVEIVIQMARLNGDVAPLLNARRHDKKTAQDVIQDLCRLASMGAPEQYVKAWGGMKKSLDHASEHLQMKKRFQALKN